MGIDYKSQGVRGRSCKGRRIPEACIARLSLYIRELATLDNRRVGFVSSRWLANHLGLTDTQVRRDLSYFGQFGTSGRGYEVGKLKERLTEILGVSYRVWNVVLAGVGNLGSALLAYGGFKEHGFIFQAVVDTDLNKVGKCIRGIKIEDVGNLFSIVKKNNITIGMIAVPFASAQEVCDQLVSSGVKAIVNFAPVRLKVPLDIKLRTIDLAIELDSLAFHLSGEGGNSIRSTNSVGGM